MVDWGSARAVISLISGKWDLTVMAELEHGPRGYNELLNATGVDGKQLARVLRRLNDAGVVARQVHGGNSPIRVTYRLTCRARALLGPLDALSRRWSSRTKAATQGVEQRAANLGIDASTPNAARIYDYFLGGKDNFAVDRAAAEKVLAVLPGVAHSAQVNRAFLGRVMEFLINEAGIRQFLDLGAGLPTQANAADIATRLAPEARIVCVDNDPVVLSHARALVRPGGQVAIVLADLRNPGSILDDPQTRALLDFSKPVALLMVSILHSIRDEEDPPGIVARFRDSICPGSYLTIAHAGAEQNPDLGERVAAVCAHASAPMVPRPREHIQGLFEGFDLVSPGLVPGPAQWRPQQPATWRQGKPIEYVGVGRKRSTRRP